MKQNISPGTDVSSLKKVRNTLAKFNWGAYGVVAATIAIWIFFNLTTKGLFLSPRNLTLMLVQGVVLGIIVNGVLFVMVTGNIDISIASTVGLCATIAAWLQAVHGWNTFSTILLVVIVGIVIGLFQGAWIAYIGIPAFIVTLAGQTIFRGLAYMLNHGQTFSPMTNSFKYIAGGAVPPNYSVTLLIISLAILGVISFFRAEGTNFSSRMLNMSKSILPIVLVFIGIGYIAVSYRGIPVPVLLLVALVIFTTFISSKTRFGRHLYAIGGNKEASILAGINVKLHVLLVFAGMGALYAFSGIVLASRVNGAPPDPALFMEMDAITACVIGGTSMFGGIGTIPGAILGAVLLNSLNNGMDLMGISTFMQYVVKGCVLLLAVLLDIALKKREKTN